MFIPVHNILIVYILLTHLILYVGSQRAIRVARINSKAHLPPCVNNATKPNQNESRNSKRQFRIRWFQLQLTFCLRKLRICVGSVTEDPSQCSCGTVAVKVVGKKKKFKNTQM